MCSTLLYMSHDDKDSFSCIYLYLIYLNLIGPAWCPKFQSVPDMHQPARTIRPPFNTSPPERQIVYSPTLYLYVDHCWIHPPSIQVARAPRIATINACHLRDTLSYGHPCLHFLFHQPWYAPTSNMPAMTGMCQTPLFDNAHYTALGIRYMLINFFPGILQVCNKEKNKKRSQRWNRETSSSSQSHSFLEKELSLCSWSIPQALC